MRVTVVGASGYSGAELTALLLAHPAVEQLHLVSRTYSGQPVAAVLPHLRLPAQVGRQGKARAQELRFEELTPAAAGAQSDCIFTATPAGAARAWAVAAAAAASEVRLIDLGADFRLHDAALYPKFYGFSHDDQTLPLLAGAVYGLPEWHKEEIRTARLVANPGCYPTATLLSTLPLAAAGLLGGGAVAVVGLSGVSGAGATPAPGYHFPAMTENVRPYQPLAHRHAPEIEQELAASIHRQAGRQPPVLGQAHELGAAPLTVNFVPELVPMSRGILTTSFVPLARPVSSAELRAIYVERYASAPFVRVLEEGQWPQTKAVQGSNYCDLAVRASPDGRLAVACAAIDNLRKGAAGQAIQNMNLMLGLAETTGLEAIPLWP